MVAHSQRVSGEDSSLGAPAWETQSIVWISLGTLSRVVSWQSAGEILLSSGMAVGHLQDRSSPVIFV